MNNSTKVLLLLVAAAAFVAGMVINSGKVSSQIDTQALLTARLLDPGDQAIAVESQLGQLTLVNFWASWCAPCRDEMPIFEAMYRQSHNRGFQVLGIAIDNPEKAQPMLDSMDITYPILYAEQTGMQVMESAGNPQGLLPYSLLLNGEGQVLDQVLGKIDERQIQEWLVRHLP